MAWHRLDRTEEPFPSERSGAASTHLPEREHHRLLALHRVSTLVAGQRRMEDVLHEALRGAVSLIGAGAGAVYRWDPDRGVLHPDQTVGMHEALVPAQLLPGEGIAGQVFLRQTSIVENDYQRSGFARPASRGAGLRAMLAVPLSHGGRQLGVLALCRYEGASTFDDEDARLLELFAAQVSVALDNAELNARLEARLERIRTLSRLARLVLTSLNLDDVLHQIAGAAVELTGASFASFWLADEGARLLRLEAASDDAMAADFPLRTQRFGHGLAGRVAETRLPLLLDDVFADGAVSIPEWWKRHGLKTALTIPVVHDGSLVAVTCLAGHEPLHLDEAESEVLESFLTQAAVAIRNASLYSALRRSQGQLEAIVDHSPAAISLKDREGRYLLANQCWLDQFPVSGAGPIGRTDAEMFPPARAQPARERDREVLEQGRTLKYETTIEDGRVTRTYLAIKFPLVDARGLPYAVCTISTDITERKRWEDDLAAALTSQRAANEQLEQLSRAKSDFLSVLSHELRSPLTGITGFSELILHRELPVEAVREYVEDISREAKRLNRMINELLELDRMESGQMMLRRSEVDLGAILREVAGQARPRAPKHRLRLDLDPTLPTVPGDGDKLTQVVVNLLDNAIKYSPNGGEVSLGARVEGRFVQVWVTDQGVGIPAEAIETIFDRYTRLEAGLGSEVVGTGLGLPIVRQIVELHGGRVWAESDVGHGSTFYVSLPLDG